LLHRLESSVVRSADLISTIYLSFPAMNRWAIFDRPLRGLIPAISLLQYS